MLIEDLQAAITSAATVTQLTGTASSRPDSTNGVFPTQAPDQPTMPYIVIGQVGGEPLQTSFDGTGALTGERWRFSCYGSTYKGAKNLAKALRMLLLGLNGPQPTTVIQGAWQRLEADEAVSIGRGTEYSTHLDFEFNYVDLNEVDP